MKLQEIPTSFWWIPCRRKCNNFQADAGTLKSIPWNEKTSIAQLVPEGLLSDFRTGGSAKPE
jgi:hypothetical protein